LNAGVSKSRMDILSAKWWTWDRVTGGVLVLIGGAVAGQAAIEFLSSKDGWTEALGSIKSFSSHQAT
jgi:hypothetical protein